MTDLWSLARAAYRAFEVALKLRVVNPFSYLNIVIFPLILTGIGLVLLAPAGGPRTAYAILGGGLIGFWAVTYLEGGNGIQDERWSGTLEQVLGVPTPLAVVLIGKLLATMLTGLLAFVPCLLLAYLVFQRQLPPLDPLPFAVSMASSVLSFFALGMALAPLYALARWIFALTNGFEVLVYALCGFMFPTSLLPGWLQAASGWLAPTWSTRALFAASGQPVGHDYGLWWGLAAVLSLGYLLVAALLFRWVEHRARVTGQLALA